MRRTRSYGQQLYSRVPCWRCSSPASAERNDLKWRARWHSWVQKPFSYQAKCLTWLREARAALSASDRGALDAIFAGTGCEALF